MFIDNAKLFVDFNCQNHMIKIKFQSEPPEKNTVNIWTKIRQRQIPSVYAFAAPQIFLSQLEISVCTFRHTGWALARFLRSIDLWREFINFKLLAIKEHRDIKILSHILVRDNAIEKYSSNKLEKVRNSRRSWFFLKTNCKQLKKLSYFSKLLA